MLDSWDAAKYRKRAKMAGQRRRPFRWQGERDACVVLAEGYATLATLIEEMNNGVSTEWEVTERHGRNMAFVELWLLRGALIVEASAITSQAGMFSIETESCRRRTKLIKKLLSRQQTLPEFGGFAFRTSDLRAILDKAALICALEVDAPLCKVCRFRSEHGDLLIEAGFGRKPEVVGKAVSKADETSPGGRAYITRKPVDFYEQHGIVSTVNVVIQGSSNGDAPYGILEIDSPEPREYNPPGRQFSDGLCQCAGRSSTRRGRQRDFMPSTPDTL